MKSVVITGASGFLGRNLVERLCEENIKVYAIVRSKHKISYINSPNLIIIELNMNQYNKLSTIINEPIDVFFHLAWQGVFGRERADYNLQIENIRCACECVEVAKKINVKKFLFLSTMSQYQKQVNDYVGLSENNIYGIAKFTANQMMRNLAYSSNMKYISCIVSNIYGPNQNKNSFISYILKSMLHGEKVKLTSCEQLADFMYVDDAVEALCILAKNNNLQYEYYIGNIEPCKLKKFVVTMRNLINVDLDIGFNEIKFNGIETDYDKINTRILLDEYKFKSKIDFSTGISKVLSDLIKTDKNNITYES